MTVSAASRPLFERRARLVIQTRTPLVQRGVRRQQIIDITDLRIAFSFKKSWKPHVGSVGHFTAYNLADGTRANMQTVGVFAQLFAGYGDFLSLVGSMDGRLNHKHEGTDWISKVEGADGGRARRFAFLGKTYSKGVLVQDVVTDLVQQIGKGLTTESKRTLDAALAGKRFSGGYAMNGYACPALEDILIGAGLTWSFQDDQILVLARDGEDGFVAGQEYFEIGPDSGLVGSPEFASPPHPGKPQLLKVKMLLNPVLRVGSRFRLVSQQRKGDFKIWTITHTGDTYGGDWYTEVEGQLLQGGQ